MSIRTSSNYFLVRVGFENTINRRVFLKNGSNLLGRDRKSDIHVPSIACSRTHCNIFVTDDDKVKIKDMNTSNGTFINTNPIKNTEVEISPGDIIAIGGRFEPGNCSNNTADFVYKLQKNVPAAVVDLSNHDEMTIQNDLSSNVNRKNSTSLAIENNRFIETSSNPTSDLAANMVIDRAEDDEDEEEEVIFIPNKTLAPDIPSTSNIYVDDDSDGDSDDVRLGEHFNKEIKQEMLELDEYFESVELNPCNADIKVESRLEPKSDTIYDPYSQEINHPLAVCEIKEEPKWSSNWISSILDPIYISDDDEPDESVSSKWQIRISQGFKPEKLPVKRVKIIDAVPLKRGRSSSCSLERTKDKIRQENLKKRFKSSKPCKTNCIQEKKRRKSISEDRREKLKELAESSNKKIIIDHEVRAVTQPRVKVTWQNRGAFLTQNTQNIPSPLSKKESSSSSNSLKKSCSVSSLQTFKSTSPFTDANNADELNNDTILKELEKRINTDINSSSGISLTAITPTIPIPTMQVGLPKETMDVVNDCIQKLKSVNPKSILKKQGIIKPKRKIQWANKLEEVREFVVIVVNDEAVTADLNIESQNNIRQLKRFQDDPCDQIKTDITSWLPKWLNDKNPPINGVGHILQPMRIHYENFESFQNIMAPIMKEDLWTNISKDYLELPLAKRISITLHHFSFEHAVNRFKYHCQMINASENKEIWEGDIVIVIHGNEQFFAIITERQIQRLEKNIPLICFIMESAPVSANESITTITKQLNIQPVTNIKSELGIFNAMFLLHRSVLADNILHPLTNEFPNLDSMDPTYYGYNTLNIEQKAILMNVFKRCLSAGNKNIILIDGPPGTGKSRLITNLLLQFVYGRKSKQTLLVCAHSNAAVNIIAKRLLKIRNKMRNKPFKVVRFGLPDRIDPEIKSISVQYLAQTSDLQLEELSEEKKTIELKIAVIRLKAKSKDYDFNMQNELIRLNNKLAMVETSINQLKATFLNSSNKFYYYLQNADIICATVCSCIILKKYINSVNICIVDEASQCTEPTTLLPLQLGVSSLILVGDTRQLPATVRSMAAKTCGYDQSLFSRIQNAYAAQSKDITYRLRCQYRMNPEICDWPNRYFYDKKLISVDSTLYPTFLLQPYTIISLNYKQNHNGPQCHRISNVNEADFIIRLLIDISKKMQLDQFSIGVVTPYDEQKRELIKKTSELPFNLMINTIDSYQGEEKDIIIISSTRTHGVGFLADRQRLNVALTRAKQCLIICGNFISVKHSPPWKSLLTDAENRKRLFQYNPNANLKDEQFTETINKYLLK